MRHYFKSTYERVLAYSPNWYGTLDFAPPAVVELYNDREGWCIGYMESELPKGVIPLTENEYKSIFTALLPRISDGHNGIWAGDALANRWKPKPEYLDEETSTYEEKQNMAPDCLYKYMRREHAQELLEIGKIRITTLYECRKAEKYNDPVVITLKALKEAGVQLKLPKEKTTLDFQALRAKLRGQ